MHVLFIYSKLTNRTRALLGAHGYDNILKDVQVRAGSHTLLISYIMYTMSLHHSFLLQASFIAHGPAFRKGYVSEPFANIELYNLMCGELREREREREREMLSQILNLLLQVC